jgi:hypothetical protein
MMAMIYIAIGIVIGLFIPGPFNEKIKDALKALWHKIVDKVKN